ALLRQPCEVSTIDPESVWPTARLPRSWLHSPVLRFRFEFAPFEFPQWSPASFFKPGADIPEDVFGRPALSGSVAHRLHPSEDLSIPSSLHTRFRRWFQALQK